MKQQNSHDNMSLFFLNTSSHIFTFYRDFRNLYKTDTSELTLVNEIIMRSLLSNSQMSTKSEDLRVSQMFYNSVNHIYYCTFLSQSVKQSVRTLRTV